MDVKFGILIFSVVASLSYSYEIFSDETRSEWQDNLQQDDANDANLLASKILMGEKMINGHPVRPIENDTNRYGENDTDAQLGVQNKSDTLQEKLIFTSKIENNSGLDPEKVMGSKTSEDSASQTMEPNIHWKGVPNDFLFEILNNISNSERRSKTENLNASPLPEPKKDVMNGLGLEQIDYSRSFNPEWKKEVVGLSHVDCPETQIVNPYKNHLRIDPYHCFKVLLSTPISYCERVCSCKPLIIHIKGDCSNTEKRPSRY